MVPAPIETAHERLQEAAGFPLARRAKIVKQTIETQVDALDAEHEGRPNWDARLRAAADLEALFDVLPARASSRAPSTAVQIVVESPAFARPPQVIETPPAR